MEGKLWGGRFRQPPDPAFERFSGSFGVDRRLAAAELEGTRAHARGLRRAGVLTEAELAALEGALDRLAAAWGGAAPEDEAGVEDVHTFVAQRLEALAGAAARKLQTGRSRNEQVALDLRLYLRSQRAPLEAGIGRLLAALARFADGHAEVLIPGYTHLQRAQPVPVGHHALAYAEMLLRDLGRVRDAYGRLDAACPLGSGALAGTPWAVDREAEARELGFAAPAANSLDAVSDRDFACELSFALALLGVHLSRFAEDWILYSSSEFGWLVLGEAYATGSSLMPQKKNPDALELIRGKSAAQLGRLQQVLVLLKGLPLAYNRDLQEDKEPVFAAVDAALASLAIAAGVVATAGVDAGRAAAAVADPALLATDLADLLVAAGEPFHDAHRQVGAIIAEAERQGRDFRTFSDAEFAALAPALPASAARALTPGASAARRDVAGGAAPAQVRRQAARIAAAAATLQ
jgi:argininosuccinate lyase